MLRDTLWEVGSQARDFGASMVADREFECSLYEALTSGFGLLDFRNGKATHVLDVPRYSSSRAQG